MHEHDRTVDDMRLIRVSEVATTLGVGRTTVYELMASGELGYVMIGRSRRVPDDELSALVRRLGRGADSSAVTHDV